MTSREILACSLSDYSKLVPQANGVYVQGVSEWLQPQEFVDQLSKVKGRELNFSKVPATVESISKIGDKIAEELQENMLLIRDYSYYGKGTEKKQAESHKFLAPGTKKITFKESAKNNKFSLLIARGRGRGSSGLNASGNVNGNWREGNERI